MEALSKGELFPKVVEAYSRPTRIVRGKNVDPHIEVLFSLLMNIIFVFMLVCNKPKILRW